MEAVSLRFHPASAVAHRRRRGIFFDLSSINAIRSGGRETRSPFISATTVEATFRRRVRCRRHAEHHLISFQAWTDTVKFGQNRIDSHVSQDAVPARLRVRPAQEILRSIGAFIDLGSPNAKGTMRFDAILTPAIPEPVTVSMLGGTLLLL
jgi:hypothetical protein